MYMESGKRGWNQKGNSNWFNVNFKVLDKQKVATEKIKGLHRLTSPTGNAILLVFCKEFLTKAGLCEICHGINVGPASLQTCEGEDVCKAEKKYISNKRKRGSASTSTVTNEDF